MELGGIPGSYAIQLDSGKTKVSYVVTPAMKEQCLMCK